MGRMHREKLTPSLAEHTTSGREGVTEKIRHCAIVYIVDKIYIMT
jgi:hypothetical protein